VNLNIRLSLNIDVIKPFTRIRIAGKGVFINLNTVRRGNLNRPIICKPIYTAILNDLVIVKTCAKGSHGWIGIDNGEDSTTCPQDCQDEGVCGDGILDPGEECDEGFNNDQCGPICTDTCQIYQEQCGNSCLDSNEECDDGNTNDGDGCSASCFVEYCGDGIIQFPEECDDGNNIDEDGCSAACIVEFCGDAIWQPGLGEECDDGNGVDGDGCSTMCLAEICGNGRIDAGEECDDGNTNNEDGCSAACIVEFCGDGILQTGLGEECDDGNTNDGDGCSATCQNEGGNGDYYMDGSNGNDSNPGTPTQPFLTLQRCVDLWDGVTQISCHGTGEFNEELVISNGGPSAADRNQLIAWDTDGDGELADETFILDGQAIRNIGIDVPTSDADYVEIAYLNIRNYEPDGGCGQPDDEDSKPLHHIKFKCTEGCDDWWIHDNTFERLGVDCDWSDRGSAYISIMPRGVPNLLLENNVFDTIGGFIMRYFAGDNITIRNNTFHIVSTGIKVWDVQPGLDGDGIHNLVIEGNQWLADGDGANPDGDCQAQTAVSLAGEVIDSVIRNNVFHNLLTAIALATNETASAIPSTGIIIENNISTYDSNKCTYGGTFLSIKDDGPVSEINGAELYIQDVDIRNNFIYHSGSASWTRAVIMRSAHPYPFTNDIRFYDNVISGYDVGINADDVVDSNTGLPYPYQLNTLTFRNNIMSNIEDHFYQFNGFIPANSSSDYNALGGTANWPTWSSEANSKSCDPTFVGPRDLHLDPTDTCAMESGVSMGTGFFDIDGDSRPQGSAWEIGADEFVSGGFCGDGICNNGEDSTTCPADCQDDGVCGDGILDPGEQCDEGANNNQCGPICTDTCLLYQPQCGNSCLDPSEECDDGNNTDEDGCSAACFVEYCGDAIWQPGLGEECDDGNPIETDMCSTSCLLTYCGDGYLQDPNGDGESEQCDDGNNISEDGCSASCLVEFCGDGIIQFPEECDDGNIIDEDGCSAACIVEFCGDGILQTGLGEECDDGNTDDGDGCSATCQNEGGNGDYYMDGSNGDDSNPGTPTQPFLTLQRCIDLWDGVTQISCHGTGIFNEELVIRNGGPSVTRRNQLIAWDTDGDGDLTDETFILDGQATRNIGIEVPTSNADYVEIAYLNIRNYEPDGGCGDRILDRQLHHIKFFCTQGCDYWWVHNNTFERLGMNCDSADGSSYISVHPRGVPNAVFEDNVWDTVGGYIMRYFAGDNITIRNNTIKIVSTGIKVWDVQPGLDGDGIHNLVIEGNQWLADGDGANPDGDCQAQTAVSFAGEVIDSVIRNNVFHNSLTAISLATNHTASAIPSTGIIIENNISTYDSNKCTYGGGFLSINDVGPVSELNGAELYIQDVDIRNNFIYHSGSANWTRAVIMRSAHPYPFTNDIRFYNNAIYGYDVGINANDVIDSNTGLPYPYQLNTLTFRNNIMSNIEDRFYQFNGFIPANSSSDYNALGGTANWPTWSSEANSKSCDPTFVGPRDFHLDPTDTCAMESGVSMGTGFFDIDGDSRPQGSTWEIGADEFVSIGICGDGNVDAGEECDDGNTNDGDGCSAMCMLESSSCDNPIGINIGTNASWDPSMFYPDIMDQARKWIPSNADGTGPWDTGYDPPLREDGYPIEVPYNLDGTVPDQKLTTLLADHGFNPGGTYTVSVEGTGVFMLYVDTARQDFVAPGEYQIEVVPSSGVFLEIKESDIDDPIHNLHIVMPGYDGLPEDTLYRNFEEDLQPNGIGSGFSIIRYMDYTLTNNSTVETWEGRTLPTWYTSNKNTGGPWEKAINIANKTQTHIWANVPHLADDNYVTQLCILLRDAVDPNLDIYVELSNEIWNGQFEQSRYAQEQGQGLGDCSGWGCIFAWQARESARVFELCDQVFGEEKDRIVKVVASQGANPWTAGQILHHMEDPTLNPTGQWPHALAIAPYIGGSIGTEICQNGDEAFTITVPEVLTRLRAEIDPVGAYVLENKILTNENNMRLIAYEGGQHLVMPPQHCNADQITALTEIFAQANRDSVMGEIYTEYNDSWKANAVNDGDDEAESIFTYWIHTGGYNQYGFWGIVEYQGEGRVGTAKFDSLMNSINEYKAGCSDGGNNPPVLAPIGPQTVDEGEVSVVTIPASDADGDFLTFTENGQPPFSSFLDNGDDTATLTLAPDYSEAGSYSMTVTVSDGTDTDFETFSITVNDTNRDPVANDDADSTNEDVAVTINVLGNDSDPDGDSLTVYSVTQGANGTVINNDSNVTYIPDPNFYGTDSFTYTISDYNGGFDAATVTVTVNSVNDNPDAVDDNVSTNEDTSVTIDVLGNDSDVDGDALNVASVTQPANGTATNNGTDVTYIPDLNFNGVDSFTYTADDGNGVTDATVKLSPSTSVSLPRTSIVTATSSSVVALSSFATGGSFSPPTVTVTVAVSVPPLPSSAV